VHGSMGLTSWRSDAWTPLAVYNMLGISLLGSSTHGLLSPCMRFLHNCELKYSAMGFAFSLRCKSKRTKCDVLQPNGFENRGSPQRSSSTATSGCRFGSPCPRGHLMWHRGKIMATINNNKPDDSCCRHDGRETSKSFRPGEYSAQRCETNASTSRHSFKLPSQEPRR